MNDHAEPKKLNKLHGDLYSNYVLLKKLRHLCHVK